MPARSRCALAQYRLGLTLVELIVVMAVVTILVLFLLPAVNAVREAARRTQCENNMREIVLATVNYESLHGSFPPALPSCTADAYQSMGAPLGNYCAGPNWATQILALMKEQQLHEDVVNCMESQWQACDDCEYESGVGRVAPSYMRCPSAPLPAKLHDSRKSMLERLAKGNYAACLGAEHYRTSIEGHSTIELERATRFAQQLNYCQVQTLTSGYKTLILVYCLTFDLHSTNNGLKLSGSKKQTYAALQCLGRSDYKEKKNNSSTAYNYFLSYYLTYEGSTK